MTLLSRGIGGGQGMGSLDNLISKLSEDKKDIQNNIETFNSNLYGVKSSMNYVGEKGKGILQTYNNTIESLMDQYASDPSQELKNKISEVVVQAKDFANKAVAERQVAMEQLNDIVANPQNYDIGVDEARKMFTDRFDAKVQARFDMNSNEMYLDEKQGSVRLGAYGQYNGENPFFIAKRSEMDVISPVGEWGATNKDLFDFNSPTLGDDVKESFIKTARYDDKLSSTAVFNYLNDVEKLPVGSMSETAVAKAVQDIKNDPEKLNEALEYHGNLEAKKLQGYVTSANDAKFKEEWGKVFTGGVNDLENDPVFESFSMDKGLTQPSGAVAPNAGVFMTYDLKTPIDNSAITALGEDVDIISFNVDEIGRFHVLERVIETDEDGVEILTERENIYGAGTDIYNSLKNIVPAQLRAKMQQNSQVKANEYKSRQKQDRVNKAKENTERKSQTQTEKVSTQEPPVLTEEKKAAEVSKVVSDIGLNSPVSAKQTQSVFDATTHGGRPVLRPIVEALVEKGYNADQITRTLQGDVFERMLKDEGIGPDRFPLRRGISSIADAVFGWTGYKTNMAQNRDKMIEIAEEAMKRSEIRSNILEGADRGVRELDKKEPVKLIPVSKNSPRDDKAENYRIIKKVAEEVGVKFPEIVAAQFALESTYGEKHSGKNNVFGIKYTSGNANLFEKNGIQVGKEEVTTHEETNGEKKKIKDDFFTFNSLEDAVRAYDLFIKNNQRYKSALSAETPEEYAKELQDAGYATAGNYAKSVMRTMISNEKFLKNRS
jgi:flagellum-specific peptidoglycan hydrolase FlgJ